MKNVATNKYKVNRKIARESFWNITGYDIILKGIETIVCDCGF